MFGRDDKLENIRVALNALECDMNTFQSWKKQYEKMNRQRAAVQECYVIARRMTERAEADAKRLEEMLQKGAPFDRKEAAGLLKDLKQMQNRFDHEFLVSGEDREFHSIYDTLLKMGVKSMEDEKQRLIFQSEVENLLALLKENLEKEIPDMQKLSFFYLNGTDQELAQLPPAERNKRVAQTYEEKFRELILKILEEAIERADETRERLKGTDDRRSRKTMDAIRIFPEKGEEHIPAEERAQRVLRMIMDEE